MATATKKKPAAQKNDENEEPEANAGTALSKTAVDPVNDDAIEDDEIVIGGTDNDELTESEEELEVLEPRAEPRQWVVGKPPSEGGNKTEYSIFVQKPLGYMARMRFFALVSRNIANALKQGGSISFGDGLDLDSSGDESIRARMSRLSAANFSDAGSFMTLAMQLMSYSESFLLDCYVIWLDVPREERSWAKLVMQQPWDPERNQWGLKEEDHDEIVETFIDQNYDEIRRFFGERLPRLVKRVQQREKDRQDRESASAQSKQ